MAASGTSDWEPGESVLSTRDAGVGAGLAGVQAGLIRRIQASAGNQAAQCVVAQATGIQRYPVAKDNPRPPDEQTAATWFGLLTGKTAPTTDEEQHQLVALQEMEVERREFAAESDLRAELKLRASTLAKQESTSGPSPSMTPTVTGTATTKPTTAISGVGFHIPQTIVGVAGPSGPSGSTTHAELNTLILADKPDPAEALELVATLETWKSEDNKGALPEIRKLVEELVKIGDDQTRDPGLRAFINGYNTQMKKEKRLPLGKILEILLGILGTGKSNRQSRPRIEVTGEVFKPPMPDLSVLKVGATMTEIEKDFDVLARKAAGPTEVGAIHEVDMAFVESMRGLSDYRAQLTEKGPALTGGSASGEKVFSVGSKGALNFEGELSNLPGQRFYGVLFPKGFINRYGVDLRTAGSGGASAKTPNDAEFAQHYIMDNDKRVDLPSEKAFAVRAEKSTAEGQAHIHYARTNMVIHDSPTSQLAFFRAWVVGVLEFSPAGIVMFFRVLRPAK